MRKTIALLSLLLTMAFAVGCQQTQQTTGNCELGAKSGGTTTATEAECKELGGRYTG